MSARVERSAAVRRTKSDEIIVEFDAKRLKAPFLLRCGALLIDYILFIGVPVITLIIGRYSGNDGVKLLNSELSNIGWMVAFLIGLTNFIILPMFSGQSLGKMLTGLSVVRTDGKIPTFGNLLLRHFLGYPLTILTVGLGFLVSVINAKGRALHDFIAGTIVIYGQKRKK